MGEDIDEIGVGQNGDRMVKGELRGKKSTGKNGTRYGRQKNDQRDYCERKNGEEAAAKNYEVDCGVENCE